MGEPAQKPAEKPADDKIPQKVKDQLEKAEKEYVEKTIKTWEQANDDKNTRTIQIEIERKDDQWWLAHFYDRKHTDLKLANAYPLPDRRGWRAALNPVKGVFKVTDEGLQVPGTFMLASDHSPLGTGSHYEALKALTEKHGDAKNGIVKCATPKGVCLDRDTVSSMAYYWPSDIASETNADRTRSYVLTGSDKGYCIDCSGLTQLDQITQVDVRNGSSTIKWGEDTHGAYFTMNSWGKEHTLSIPASRAKDFATWSTGAADKSTAFALYIMEEDPSQPGTKKRINAYNVGNNSNSPMYIRAQQYVEVEGDTDKKLGRTYRERIPLFKADPKSEDGLMHDPKDGSLILRPMADVEKEVKAAPDKMDLQHKADIKRFEEAQKRVR